MKKNLLGIALAPISILSVFGVGFSGFVFEIEGSKSIETELKVAEVSGGEPEVIEHIVFNKPVVESTFSFSQYGFLQDYTFDKSISGEIKFLCEMNPQELTSIYGESFNFIAELTGSADLSNIAVACDISDYTFTIGNISTLTNENSKVRSFLIPFSNYESSENSALFSLKFIFTPGSSNFDEFYTNYKSGTFALKLKSEANS